jgi:hypothetical protein
MAFLIIFFLGLVLAALTFAVGELFHFGDAGADTGGDLSSEGVGHSPFSSRILFVFMTAFGGAGFVARSFDAPLWLALLAAIAGGLVVAGGTFFLIVAPMSRQQGSTRVTLADFVDMEAEVQADIPEGGVGRVSVVAPSSGARVVRAARAQSGKRIPAGTRVRITHAGAEVVTVVEASMPITGWSKEQWQ